MRIGIIDVDSHGYPNFALMKISSYHKSKGDTVEWADAMFGEYDRVYKSKIFTFSQDIEEYYNCEVVKGGTGYDIKSRLPDEIENHKGMDYSIYPQYDFSIQFYSRGCIRHCPFCLVRDKEGYITPVEPVELNPNGKWIEIFDNNFFASPNWEWSIKHLISQNKKVHFHGVDVRILKPEHCEYLKKLKHKGNIHIAWDLPQMDLEPQLKMVSEIMDAKMFSVYILVGFNSTWEQDLHRVRVCQKYGLYPFVQPYKNFDGPTRVPTQFEKDLARYANRPVLWMRKEGNVDFFDYEPRKGFKCRKYFE